MSVPGRLVAFIPTENLAAAIRFYGETLGLSMTSSHPGAATFDNDGTELRVTVVESRAGAPYTVLGWSVPDLTAAVAALRVRGVAFTRYPGMDQDTDDAWTAADGTRVTWLPILTERLVAASGVTPWRPSAPGPGAVISTSADRGLPSVNVWLHNDIDRWESVTSGETFDGQP